MRESRGIKKKEPKWHRCEQCKAQFCIAGKIARVPSGLKVKFCPYCGADEYYLQRWVLAYPPTPDEWH